MVNRKFPHYQRIQSFQKNFEWGLQTAHRWVRGKKLGIVLEMQMVFQLAKWLVLEYLVSVDWLADWSGVELE